MTMTAEYRRLRQLVIRMHFRYVYSAIVIGFGISQIQGLRFLAMLMCPIILLDAGRLALVVSLECSLMFIRSC